MGRGDEQASDEILLARLHAGAALAAATLGTIGRERDPLDVAGVRNGDDHLLALDEILFLDLDFRPGDLGTTRRVELVLDRCELVSDDRADARAAAKDFKIIGDFLAELVELGLDLVAPERSQPLQSQVENGLGLLFRKPDRAAGRG